MLLMNMNVLRGPNYWSAQRHQLIVLQLSLSEEELNKRSSSFYGVFERSFAPFYHSSKGRGFSQNVQNGLSIVEFVQQLISVLQTEAGMECGYSETISTDGRYHILFSYCDEEAGRYAAETAVAITEALLRGEEYNIVEQVAEITAIWQSNMLGPSTGSLYEEALRRGIPVIRLDEGSYLQLGYGARQKRIEATIASSTSNIAVDKAGDRHATKQLVTDAFIPVPHGTVIRHVENLQVAIGEVEFPIVIKPLDGHQGKGATINITTLEQAIEAFHKARLYSTRVVIEKFVTGFDFRALVINNKFVAAAKRTPAAVVGDGIRTISSLIDEVNNDPRRGEGHSKVLTKITVDVSTLELLARKNYNLHSVPRKGEEVWLKSTANLSTGGTAEDVTDDVHPSNIRLFERVARIIGLDICGIDLMAADLSTPIEENGGAIIEVNAAPGFRMHLEPTVGKARNVAAPVIDMLFPNNSVGRIPIVAVTGTNGKTTTTRVLSRMAQLYGFSTGMTNTDGIYLNGELVYKGDCSGPGSAKAVLKDPAVEFAVLECARGGILRSGLGFDQCDVAIVTNVAEDHLGLNGINTIEQLARVKAVVPKSVMPGGYAILNADDDLVYAMKDELECEIALFSLYPDSVRIQSHCADGGLAAVYDEGYIMIRKGDQLIPVESVENVPLTHYGKARFNIANVLGATLAAYVTNISLPAMRCTLRSFRNSVEDTPGRLNEFDFGPFTVMVDYAHNTHGVKAVGEFIQAVPAAKKIGVITAVGDRRTEDIISLGEAAAKIFDEIVIRFDSDLRGRTEFEISSLLRTGIQRSAPNKKVNYCSNELEAVDCALSMATEGSYVVILVENIKEVTTKLKEMLEQREGVRKSIRMAV